MTKRKKVTRRGIQTKSSIAALRERETVTCGYQASTVVRLRSSVEASSFGAGAEGLFGTVNSSRKGETDGRGFGRRVIRANRPRLKMELEWLKKKKREGLGQAWGIGGGFAFVDGRSTQLS